MRKEKLPYQPTRRWGDGKLLGDNNTTFFSLTPEQKASALGFSNACPVVDRLIAPEHEGGRGPESMTAAYGAVNFWFGYLGEQLLTMRRHDLFATYSSTVARKHNEPAGTHDTDWVPTEWKSQLPAPAQLHGYAFPRLLITFLDTAPDEVQDRLIVALDKFVYIAEHAESLPALLVEWANTLALHDTESYQHTYLRRLLSAGKFEEDTAYTSYLEVFAELCTQNNDLWDAFVHLTPDELEQFGVADIAYQGEMPPDVIGLIREFSLQLGYPWEVLHHMYSHHQDEELSDKELAQEILDLSEGSADGNDTFIMLVQEGLEQFAIQYGVDDDSEFELR